MCIDTYMKISSPFGIPIHINTFLSQSDMISSLETSSKIIPKNQSACIVQHYISKQTTSNFSKMPLSLHTIPVEMVYGILDHLDTLTIVVSCRNVCERLNDIIDNYHRYQVILIFHFQTHCSSFSTIFKYIFLSEITSFTQKSDFHQFDLF